MKWIDDYIGIPFLTNGRTKKGLDCYGLVRLVLMEHFGKELPLLDDGYTNAMDSEVTAHLIDIHKPTIKAYKIGSPQNGDIALMKIRGIASHVGVYIDGSILHIDRRTYSVYERVGSPRIKSRIEGYYRVN